MNLAQYPRRRYTPGATPLEFLERFTRELGGPRIFIKRDDLSGLTAGGNKTRKLEFLVADALAQGADTLMTAGGVQSNHCRLTLAAAVKEGLKCQLVLEEPVAGVCPRVDSGNRFLFHLLGVEEILWVPAGSSSPDMLAAMEQRAVQLAAQGRKAYVIPVGGSNERGACGYIACAEEIMTQSFDRGASFDYIVTPSGSAGTQAGLVLGCMANHTGIPVLGMNVSRDKAGQEQMVWDLSRRTAAFLELPLEVPREAVVCFDGYVGPGYARPTDSMVEAVRLMASTEGILLDPVYTGKAMAGLIDLVRQGYFRPEDKVLFLHTGGSPALYAYADVFAEKV
ncbi:MAG TPA: D-cysteine desulfhydrase [Patescibacteria group bacterium]|nr:D-cysteine desulfhydrase [Patescibacteria group bacterium]